MRKPLQCAGERADLQSERPARRDRDGRIELREVTIAHDFGNDVEIGSGIKAEDRVVVNSAGWHCGRRRGAYCRRTRQAGRA